MNAGAFFGAALISIAASLILCWVGIIPVKKMRMKSDIIIENAERNGFVVEGILVKSVFIPGSSNEKQRRHREDKWWSQYQYAISGKEYKYNAYFRNQPTERIKLYYDPRFPNRAITKGQTVVGAKNVAIILIPLLIFILVYWLFNTCVAL